MRSPMPVPDAAQHECHKSTRTRLLRAIALTGAPLIGDPGWVRGETGVPVLQRTAYALRCARDTCRKGLI